MDQKRSEKPDPRSQGGDEEKNAASRPPAGSPDPRPARLTDIKAGEPRETDESGDVSLQNAENPTILREEVANTSTSSGTQAGDEGDDQKRKAQLRRGAREISRMD